MRLLYLEIDNSPNGRPGPPDAWRARFTATTAADGVWTLPGIPQTGKAAIALDDDRYVHEQQDITLVAGEKAQAVRFTVRPGAILTGRVLTPEGTPAADARVWANIDSANYSDVNQGSGKTTADGSYRFAGLATGTYTVNAYSEKQEWLADAAKSYYAGGGQGDRRP